MMTRALAKSVGVDAIGHGNAPWGCCVLLPSGGGLHRITDRLRHWFGSASGWLAAAPPRRDPSVEADRLMQRWGDLAPDVARAMAARESAGLFDDPGTGFWNDVAVEIETRRGRTMTPGRPPET